MGSSDADGDGLPAAEASRSAVVKRRRGRAAGSPREARGPVRPGDGGHVRLVLADARHGRLFHVTLTAALPHATRVGSAGEAAEQTVFGEVRNHLLRQVERHLHRRRSEIQMRRLHRLGEEREEALPDSPDLIRRNPACGSSIGSSPPRPALPRRRRAIDTRVQRASSPMGSFRRATSSTKWWSPASAVPRLPAGTGEGALPPEALRQRIQAVIERRARAGEWSLEAIPANEGCLLAKSRSAPPASPRASIADAAPAASRWDLPVPPILGCAHEGHSWHGHAESATLVRGAPRDHGPRLLRAIQFPSARQRRRPTRDLAKRQANEGATRAARRSRSAR